MASLEADIDTNATLSILNHPASRLPGPSLLHQLIQTQAQDGAAPAIDFLAADDTRSSLSYSEFHAAADALASRISTLIGGSEPFVVPVLIPQCPVLYIAQLAILKAGGAFCPLNLDIPVERARLILDEVKAKVVITTEDLSSKLPDSDGRAILLVGDGNVGGNPVASSGISRRQPRSTDLAYVMYTSGSTGTPKGVGISHDVATQSLLGHDRHIPEFSRFLQFAAPTFDVSVFEIFFPFFRGKTLVSCDRSALLNNLPAVLRAMDVDACELTPSVAGSLLRMRENAPNLRLLLTIGEMLTGPVIREFGGSEGRDSILWGMYGPTEAAIHCTVQPAFGFDSLVGNIGVPFDTVSAFILSVPDEDRPPEREVRVLPRGEAGELAIGGYQTAEEYINRPEQTATAFVDTPFGRLYKTGDKARIRPNGTLECLGRIGFGQVKLRGQRIELGEIEHAALRTPGCHGAFAVIIKNVLVLFCAVDEVGGMTQQIEDTCKRWLPGFMVPGDIVVAKDFPRLPSGKVDRKSLATNYSALDTSEGVRYADDLERQLCEIAARALSVDVRPESILSKVGVDSLVAIKLASEFQEAGVEIGAVDILLSRTFLSLKSRVLEKRAATAGRADSLEVLENRVRGLPSSKDLGLGLLVDEVEEVIPCTPLQSSMLAETMANPQAYCNWIELSFPADCSQESVRSWFLQLAKTNEALRTGFVHYQGRFLQVIFDNLNESMVVMVDRPTKEFKLEKNDRLLHPFRVQIANSAESDHRVVVVQLHHAMYDGWSMDMILSDLRTLRRGATPDPRPQFRLVAEYYQSQSFKQDCDAARGFWAEQLVALQPPTVPQVLAEIPAERKVISASVLLDLRPESVKKSLRKLDCGSQILFQAALAWLWGSFLGIDDVVLGTVTSGRTLSVTGIQDTIGPCIAPVPIRTNLSQVRTIKDLLSSVHTGSRAALLHSILPLGEIKRIAGVRSGQPLYDALFVYQESLFSGDRAADGIKEIAHRDYLETKLLVEVEPGLDNFVCRLTSRSDVFTERQLIVMGQSIHAVAQNMLGNLDSDLVAVRSAFPEDLLSVHNPTPKYFPGIPDLAYAVEQVATENPDKDALCFVESIADGMVTTTTVTFGWLNKLANRIAWHLKDCGVAEGDTVAIIMEKSVLLYAGILAILKAGAAYLPLLPNTPLARVGTIFEHAGVKVCLSDTNTRNHLSTQLTCTILNLQSARLQDYPPASPPTRPDPTRPAYIIFTSGSTGVPKGVCVTQLNIVSNLDVLSRIYPVNSNSRLLQSCSQAFDVSVFEIFFAWTTGMCLCSGTNDTLFEDLERVIRTLKVTHLSMTPTVAGLVDPVKVPGVEVLVTAGEPMTEVVAAAWGQKLFQGYGPSETTNICSVKRMGGGSKQVIRHLGWAFENTSTVVMYPDSDEVVPLSSLGELCFGGDQVAKGYPNQPRLTVKNFIHHPVYGKLYRSGDLGRMLPDGSMVIDGRMDDQVKIRGQRVELDEVTTTVRQAERVADCATILLKDDGPASSQRIVTFFVPQSADGAKFRIFEFDKEVEDHIQQMFRQVVSCLPGYMVPSFLVPISVLPTTPSGKLDKTGLIAAFRNLRAEELALAAPTVGDEDDGEWSDSERRIASLIADIFGVEVNDIQRWTPLMTFGLDSISAIEVAKRINDGLGKRLPISEILSNASVARLAHALQAAQGLSIEKQTQLLPEALIETVSAMFADRGTMIEDMLPCTPLQEAMLAVSAGRGRYLNRMLLRVNTDTIRLREAWEAVCKRQGILRTCFVSTPDLQRPIIQVVLEGWEPPWKEMDAAGSSIEACVLSHAATLPPAIDSFEPTVSFAIINDGDATYLSFVCHHALYDGVAVERLLFEVEQTLAGKALDSPPSYGSFLQESLQLPTSTDSFWRKKLEGFKPHLLTQLSAANPEPEAFTISRSMATSFSTITERVKALGISLLSVTQAIWATVLSCLFRNTDICFGCVVSGRSLALKGIHELVAPCFNTIPVRVDFSDSRQSIDLIKSFQTLNPELLVHQFTPLRRIQSTILKGEVGRLFDTLLLLQQPSLKLDESVWSLERDDGEMDIPVVCELMPDTHDDLLTAKLHIEAHRFPRGVAELILDLFSYVIETTLQFPASAIPTMENLPNFLSARLLELPFEEAARATDVEVQEPATELWTPTESAIRSVIAGLSSAKLERIRRYTTIYQLGLDSISAIQVASLLRKQGLDVSASDAIDHPTCEKLGRYLDSRTQNGNDVNGHSEAGVNGVNHISISFDIDEFRTQILPQLERQGWAAETLEEILPCTPLQAGMMAQFLKSGGHDYFNFLEFHVESGVSETTLVEAWRRVRDAYPILRTGIISVEHDDFPFAIIQHRSDELCSTVDLSSQDEGHNFDPEKWRFDAAREALRDPRFGLWRAAVVERVDHCEMHLAMHHALYDAQSLQGILSDLARGVRADGISQPSTTREAVVDILVQIHTGRDGAETFWREQAKKVVINGFPVMTPLRETTRNILVQSATSNAPFKSLESAASASGYTLQAILQAAWTRVLSSYLGESTVVFGVVLSGRTTDATQAAVFPCITTLPVVSTNVSSNRRLLDDMLGYNADLYKQQHQPLTQIQHWLGCSDSRLFDTLLVYQKFSVDTYEARPWRIVEDQATVDYPVSIEVEPMQDGTLRYQITYFDDVLPTEQAHILLKQFDAIIQHLALHPDEEEADLVGSSPEIFSLLPAAQPALPTPVQTLHQFVEYQAIATPAKTALHFVDGFDGDTTVSRKWTYAELNSNGNRVANTVLPHVKVGDIVAIDFDKCPEAYFSILGILKAGAAFVALDPGAPAARKQFILEDSGASVLLTSRTELEYRVSVPILKVDEELLGGQSPDLPLTGRDIEPSDVCYCLYTSGTTGTPKGCEITHDNAVQCMLAFQEIFEGHWEETSRWLQFASLHFDVSVLEQYWSWSVGITLVAAPRDLILEDLAGTISRLEITHIDLTPSLARLIRPEDVPSLCRGVFITGGESLKQEILDAWGSKAVIYNFYGPTEATIGVTVYPRVPKNGRSSNIGRQFINVGSYILKLGTDLPVLKGAVGELCVSGRLVGKGYLNRDELTTERFPTLQHFGERVYRTGDLVRVLHDGCFDFLGRADDQVKLRGQRLEIGEINHAIKTGLGEIKDVATFVVRNEQKQKDFLVSFVVTEQRKIGRERHLEITQSREASGLARRVRQACRSRLPGYMVPTYVFQLPFIPLSPNNKAEVKELRGLFNNLSQDDLVSSSSTAEGSPAQLSEVGKKIASVIAALNSVDVDRISASSSIFELGVDSISVLRFSRELKRAGLLQASPAQILRYPVIEDLAHILEAPKPPSTNALVAAARQMVHACAHRHRAYVCHELSIKPDQIEYLAPCSPLQQGMISRSATDGAYFNAFRFRLNADVSTVRLHEAWQRVVESTTILRTAFINTVDGCVQVAIKKFELVWEEVTVSFEERDKILNERHDAWIARNQDSVAQPWEILVVNGEIERILVLHIFHGLYDANSFELMVNNLAHEYSALGSLTNGLSHGEDAPSFLEALCHGPLQNFASSKDFWVNHLQGVDPAGSQSPVTGVSSRERRLSFPGLERLRSSLAVTQQAILQAAWVWTLAKYQGTDPTIGIIVSGRTIDMDGADGVVGPLFNTLPFHARALLGDALSWAELVKKCHEFNTAVLPFQHVSLRDVQKWCSKGKPLFDTLFSFQRDDGTAAGRGLWMEITSDENADYPLALEATLTSNDELKLLLVAQGEDAKLAVLMDDLDAALTAMVEDSTRAIWLDTTVLNGAGVHTISFDGNGISKASPMQNGWHFEWTEDATAIRKEIAQLANAPVDVVAETTSIFELGLDSIDVIKLSARLKVHGILIKTSQIMAAQTISRIVHLLHNQLPNGHSETNGHSATGGKSLTEQLKQLDHDLSSVEAVFPTTPLQDSMVAEMIHSDFQLYFNHDILEIQAEVDVQQLKEAWLTVISGSPILRTSFILLDDSDLEHAYCQAVDRDAHCYLAEVDLESVDDLAKITDAAVHRARKAGGRSDLLQLVFASVDGKRFLVLSIAHALYDGWSLNLLHEDVRAAYNGQFQPRPHYGAYLDEITHSSSGGSSNFWAGFLEGVSPTLIPEKTVDRKDTIFRAEGPSSVPAADITSFCKAQLITLQALGQACWAALLASRTGSLDVAFGAVLSGRDSEVSESLMFPTMNTVAIRSVLHGTVSSWLRYIQDNIANVSKFQHFPLRKAQRLVEGVTGPLFNTLFIQQRGIGGETGEKPLMKSIEGSSSVEFPVCLEMEMDEDELVWRTACDGNYLSRRETSLLLKDLDTILGYMLQHPGSDVILFSETGVSVCGLSPFRRIADMMGTTTMNGSATRPSTSPSPLDEAIRSTLSEVSGVPLESIQPTHNIYHLGLDSISAIKAVSLLRKKGVLIAFRDMLRAKSISKMAQLSATKRPEDVQNRNEDSGNVVSKVLEGVNVASTLETLQLETSSVEDILPATAMQVHMLSVWQNTNGGVFYHTFKFRLTRTVEPNAVLKAWQKLIAETPILRTTFVSTPSQDVPLLQIVHKLLPSSPYAFIKVQGAEEGHLVLQLRIHHALYDAVSLPAILDRFAALSGDHPDTLHHVDISAWKTAVAAQFDKRHRTTRKDFWTNYMSGIEPDRAAIMPNIHTSRASLLVSPAMKDITSLRSICTSRGITIQSLFFASYAAHLASSSSPQPKDVVFGIYLANRAENNLPMFPTLCLVPLRVRINQGDDLITMAERIQDDLQTISARPNVDVGLWEVLEWTGVKVDSFVNFLSVPSQSAKLNGTAEEGGAVAFEEITTESSAVEGDEPWEIPEEVKGNVIRHAYPDGIDVEVAIQGEEMIIGVFGLRGMLGEQRAQEIVDGIVLALEGIAKG